MAETKETPVTYPMVGLIVSIDVKVGDKVKENNRIATIESMKMQMPVPAPVSGTIKEIKAKKGEVVQQDQVIAIIE